MECNVNYRGISNLQQPTLQPIKQKWKIYNVTWTTGSKNLTAAAYISSCLLNMQKFLPRASPTQLPSSLHTPPVKCTLGKHCKNTERHISTPHWCHETRLAYTIPFLPECNGFPKSLNKSNLWHQFSLNKSMYMEIMLNHCQNHELT